MLFAETDVAAVAERLITALLSAAGGAALVYAKLKSERRADTQFSGDEKRKNDTLAADLRNNELKHAADLKNAELLARQAYDKSTSNIFQKVLDGLIDRHAEYRSDRDAERIRLIEELDSAKADREELRREVADLKRAYHKDLAECEERNKQLETRVRVLEGKS